jgi:hypothetical protein
MHQQPNRQRSLSLGAIDGHIPVPQWAQEMSPHHHGPTGGGVLALAVIAVLLALLLQLAPTTDSGRSATSDREQGVSLCDEHPHWSVCQEPSRTR